MSQLKDDIDSILSIRSASIPEKVLKEVYLPLLFDPDPGAFNKRWILECAGSASNRVDILGLHDQVIGTVPPLRSSPVGDITNKLPHSLNEASLHIDRHAVSGTALLNRILAISVDLKTYVTPELQKEWIDLLIHYGYQDKILNLTDNHNGISDNDVGSFIEEDDW